MKFTVIYPEVVSNHAFYLHAQGCADVAKWFRTNHGSQGDFDGDLADEDAMMAEIDGDDLGYGFHDVKVYPCCQTKAPKTKLPRGRQARAVAIKETEDRLGITEPTPMKVPTTKPAKNGAAYDKAAKQAQEILQGLIDKLAAERGSDDVGLGDKWANERVPDCDDYRYDLAVEVRKLREAGESWWRIANKLMLPGAGASAKQGKSGAAFARRLWESAWGHTYSDGEKAPRDTTERKRERAATDDYRPVFAEDASEMEIIEAIKGKEIHWAARLGEGSLMVTSPQSTVVYGGDHSIKLVQGPKGRVVEFYEMLSEDAVNALNSTFINTGPRRSVYLNRIYRVGA